MITEENDDGVLPEPVAVERVEDSSDLRIHKGNTGEVGEELRQQDDLGMPPAHRNLVAEDAGGIRPKPREERRAARIANRVLAMRAIEAHPARREPVEVRRFDLRVAVAAEARAQIVSDDEEDVEGASRRGGGRTERAGEN